MKRKYIAPLTSEVPVQTMNILENSIEVIGNDGDNLNIDFGGEDDGTHEGNANFYHWDSFDNAPL